MKPCPDCWLRDTVLPWPEPNGNGKCSVCYGEGYTGPFGKDLDHRCVNCEGSGLCATCDGDGEIEGERPGLFDNGGDPVHSTSPFNSGDGLVGTSRGYETSGERTTSSSNGPGCISIIGPPLGIGLMIYSFWFAATGKMGPKFDEAAVCALAIWNIGCFVLLVLPGILAISKAFRR